MKFTPRNSIKKFQMGGEVAPEQEAPEQEAAPQEQEAAPQGGQEDPIMQIAQIAMQALQNQDCQAAMQVCQVFVQMAQQAGGQGAPQQQAGEPVFRKGGILVKRIRK